MPRAPRTATATAERLLIQKIVLRPARPRRRKLRRAAGPHRRHARRRGRRAERGTPTALIKSGRARGSKLAQPHRGRRRAGSGRAGAGADVPQHRCARRDAGGTQREGPPRDLFIDALDEPGCGAMRGVRVGADCAR